MNRFGRVQFVPTTDMPREFISAAVALIAWASPGTLTIFGVSATTVLGIGLSIGRCPSATVGGAHVVA